MNATLVSEMLGYVSIAQTLQTSSYLLPVMQGDAAAAMDAILAG